MKTAAQKCNIAFLLLTSIMQYCIIGACYAMQTKGQQSEEL
jgi:hypothetical protein